MKVIDIHIHGAFGICFDNAGQEKIREFAKKAFEKGLIAFCPTLTGDTAEKLNEKLNIINEVMQTEHQCEARVLGANLEGTFLNKERSGIQDYKNFLPPTIENFKKITKGVENAVKIVVLAPEVLDSSEELIKYLKAKNIKVHFGHSLSRKTDGADCICHLFNAMEPISHKHQTLALKALLSKEIYTELIADTIHVCPDMLKLAFKIRPENKIILISDALPAACSDLDFVEFCGKKILKNGHDENGTLAGSVMLLPDIAQNLVNLGFLTKEAAEKMAYANIVEYLKISI